MVKKCWYYKVFKIKFLSPDCHCEALRGTWQSNLISFSPLPSTDCHAPLLFARNDLDEMGKFLSPDCHCEARSNLKERETRRESVDGELFELLCQRTKVRCYQMCHPYGILSLLKEPLVDLCINTNALALRIVKANITSRTRTSGSTHFVRQCFSVGGTNSLLG
ncbi:hypothetical protein MCEGE10_02554 [Flavobacteriaceae bacterium]